MMELSTASEADVYSDCPDSEASPPPDTSSSPGTPLSPNEGLSGGNRPPVCDLCMLPLHAVALPEAWTAIYVHPESTFELVRVVEIQTGLHLTLSIPLSPLMGTLTNWG